MTAEVSRDDVLELKKFLELWVVFDNLITASLQVVNEWTLAMHVILADCPRQEVGAVLRGSE